MNERYYAVILAGGRGERFWPLSTSHRPKQLLSLVSRKSLLAEAVDRLQGLIPPERVFVITTRDLVAASREAAPRLPPGHIVGEPVGRDTAAAVAVGAGLVQARRRDGVFCVLTADHVIGDVPVFQRTLAAGLAQAAEHEALITIGIPPVEPNTGYGYIDAGEGAGARDGVEFLKVRRFVEKPDLATAKQYCAAGHFYWNSGMFVWSVGSLEAAFRTHRPALAGLSGRVSSAPPAELDAVLDREYGVLEKISIDYALMEKAGNIIMAKSKFAWDDVGSWTALTSHLPKDPAANAVAGTCEVLDAESNVVISQDRLTALIGVKDLVVVQAEGVTLICPKDRAQDVKKLVEKLKATGKYDEVL